MILRQQDKVGLNAYYSARNMTEDEINASHLNMYSENLENTTKNKNQANREINKRTNLQDIINYKWWTCCTEK